MPTTIVENSSTSTPFQDAERVWTDLTFEVANKLEDFFRLTVPQLSQEDREELEVEEIRALIRLRSQAQDTVLCSFATPQSEAKPAPQLNP